MKRYEEIENMILSRDLTDEEVMIEKCGGVPEK